MVVVFASGYVRSREWKNLEHRQTGVGGLENWTVFMDVLCVSSLISQKNAAKFHVM